MKRSLVVLAFGAALLALLAGCGGSTNTATGASTSAGPHATGKVQVLYAGSLANLMENGVGPAFNKATGATFEGTAAGSTALVTDIKGKVKPADVFISASTDANNGLMGSANGNWESWYAVFGSAPLVIGYNPNSRFANDLKTKPWNQVVTEAGFRLGSTDPQLDPKGKLAATALQQENIPTSVAQVFPEEQLVGRLQAGQLDAGFFYSSEAAEAHIPTITLGSVKLQATYTISVLNNAPNKAGAIAFVEYLLGPDGRKLMQQHGLTLLATPTVTGDTNAVPQELDDTVGVK